jgi:hypothetical protein
VTSGPTGAFGPVVVRRRLGAELRRLREAAGLRLDQVASELEISAAKISRLETGQSIAKTWDVRNMLTIYGVRDEAARKQILGWVEESKATGWWHRYSDVIPMNLDYYISLEAEAASVSLYAVLMPALLQTPAYARALLADLFADVDRIDDAELDGLVEVRLGRQEALARSSDPLRLSVVLAEAALHRPVGGAAVMREQFAALLRAPSSVELRVRPLSAPIRRFTLSSFAVFLPRLSSLDATVINIEAAGREYYLEDPEEAAHYQGAFQTLWNESLSANDSLSLIQDLAS